METVYNVLVDKVHEHGLQTCKISAHLTESREEYAKMKIIDCWESEGCFSFLA